MGNLSITLTQQQRHSDVAVVRPNCFTTIQKGTLAFGAIHQRGMRLPRRGGTSMNTGQVPSSDHNCNCLVWSLDRDTHLCLAEIKLAIKLTILKLDSIFVADREFR